MGPIAPHFRLSVRDPMRNVSSPGPTIRVLCLLFLNDLAQKLSSVVYMLDKIISSFVHHPFSTSLAMASRAIRLRSAALV